MRKKAETESRPTVLGAAKLATSGLSLDDAKTLKIDILAPSATQNLHPSFKFRPSLKINYYTPDGHPMSDMPSCPPFYRIRFLGSESGFEKQTTKKEVRYMQEPNTAPCAYYPQSINWKPIVDDVDVPLIITEGELKAAKACAQGFPTIGLGGVYNWRAYNHGMTWIPSLDLVKWQRRNVYIIFDSDYKTNPLVCLALKELCQELHNKGSLARIVTLPTPPDGQKKVGLDDYLIDHSDEDLRALLKDAVLYGITEVLWNLNEQYVCVLEPPVVISKRTKTRMHPTVFRDYVSASTRYLERTLKKNGEFGYEQVPAALPWLRWPFRTQVDKLGYHPGKGEFTDLKGVMNYNIWPGWGIKPEEGDHDPFIKLASHLFSTTTEEDLEWFFDWCAYPLQNPGAKLFTSVVIYGIKHGTGKSLLGYTLGRIYGENFSEIKQSDLHGDFNEWAVAKQFVLGDDVTGSNKRADADLLKKMITQKTMRINQKYVPSYEITDCINYYFTSNQPDAFFLEDDDRRYFIHQVEVQPLDELFYAEYDLWLDTGGAAAVFDWLLKRDLSRFNPAAPARKTAAREQMIADVRSDLGAWVRKLLENPDFYLRQGKVQLKQDLYTNKDLLVLYDPTGSTGTTGNGLGRELTRAGAKKVRQGAPIKLSDGSVDRYYIIRNNDKWGGDVGMKDVITHLEVSRTNNSKY